MIIHVFNRDILEILTIFSISPGSRFLRKELKEKTRLNNVNLDNSLAALMNSGIIKKEGRFLSLNLDRSRELISIISSQYKKAKELPLDAYFSIIAIVYFLSKFKGINVYLFGSYSKLVYKDTSDIDLAIVADKIDDKAKKEINALAQKTELRYGKKIELHYFGLNFYKNRKDSLVREILKNGLRLI